MLTRIFRKMAEIRHFELGLMEAHRRKLTKCPIYLSMGQESIAATLSELYPECKVFPQHRGHACYLAWGGSPEKLRDEILGLETGCCEGMGGSSDIQSDNVIAHNGLLGTNISIGTGYCFAKKEPIIIYAGDGAYEEDYASVALGWAATHGLPILFICVDNGLAILTPIKDRRHWSIVSMAKGYGLEVVDIEDDPNAIIFNTRNLKNPALMNIKTIRQRWHVGDGKDFDPVFDRYVEVKKSVEDADRIEQKVADRMRELWKL